MLHLRFLRLSAVAGLALLTILSLAASVRAAEVQKVLSPGGIEAWLIEDHSNPILAIEFAFSGGAALDPAGKEGLANMVSGLLDEGAGSYDSTAFRTALENNSISLSYSASKDTFSGSLRTLTRNREKAVELLRLSLTEPRFDAEPLERIKAQILTGIARREKDPDALAGRTLWQLLYPDHAYGRETSGTVDSIAAIDSEDLWAFVAERLNLKRLKIGVVGDITASELASLLDEAFGALPAAGDTTLVADVAPANLGETVVIDAPIPQSIVAFAQPGLKRDDPDYYVAYVVNHILGGGGFTSRLFAEVREKRGLAYSVYSYLLPLDHTALVYGGVATAGERVGDSLNLIRAEWERLAEEGPTAEELEAAKTYLTGSFPLRFSNSGRIAGMLLGMQIENLGIDYLERRNDYIDAVTLEDARRVARKLFDVKNLTVVVVGQPQNVVPTRAAPEEPPAGQPADTEGKTQG
ncbi:pitrilysin family protein [Limibacillus sp. MBR-115]|jgi:zinc protease|uniref:M16 family metallopeptidase n=1 Tax=Limibacillus sp. MBR-115 TaxID=3156465 RepID=UPI0033942006